MYKKVTLFLLLLLGCKHLHALPLKNPADPVLLDTGLLWNDCFQECNPCDPWPDFGAFHVKFGYYGDFIFNSNLVISDSSEVIEDAEFYTNSVYIALNLWQRFELYTALGGTEGTIHSNGLIIGLSPLIQCEIETDPKFSWLGGFQAILWQKNCIVIGATASYFNTHVNVRRISFGIASVYPDDDLILKFHEWQFGLGLSYQIENFIPYVGLKYSQTNVYYEGLVPGFFEVLPEYESKNNLGIAIGGTFLNCYIMSLNVEGRFIDEKAITVNAQVQF